MTTPQSWRMGTFGIALLGGFEIFAAQAPKEDMISLPSATTHSFQGSDLDSIWLELADSTGWDDHALGALGPAWQAIPQETPEAQVASPNWHWSWRGQRPASPGFESSNQPWRQGWQAQTASLNFSTEWKGDSVMARQARWQKGDYRLTLGDLSSTSGQGELKFLLGRGMPRSWSPARVETGPMQALAFSRQRALNGFSLEGSQGKIRYQALGSWQRLQFRGSSSAPVQDAGLVGLTWSQSGGSRRWSGATLAYRLEQDQTLQGASLAQGLAYTDRDRGWTMALGGLGHRNMQGTWKADALAQTDWLRRSGDSLEMGAHLRWAGQDWIWPWTPQPASRYSPTQEDSLFPAPARGRTDVGGRLGLPLAFGFAWRAQVGAIWNGQDNWEEAHALNTLAWSSNSWTLRFSALGALSWPARSAQPVQGMRWRQDAAWTGKHLQLRSHVQWGSLRGMAWDESPLTWSLDSRLPSAVLRSWNCRLGFAGDGRQPKGITTRFEVEHRRSRRGWLRLAAWAKPSHDQWLVGLSLGLATEGSSQNYP